MRKTAAALATVALTAVALAGSTGASGAQPIDEVDELACDALGVTLCEVLTEGGGLEVPSPDELLAPLGALPVAPVEEAAPDGSAAPEPTAEPAPSSSSASSSTVGSTSSSAPTGFSAPVSAGNETARVTSPAVPSVPVGSTLHLGSLGMPELRLTGPAAAAAAERSVGDVVLPAARAAAGAEALPDDGGAMAVLGVLSALLVAGGLLIDRFRKARHVIPS